MAKLTIRQEAFCQAYMETGNASEAYRLSYACANSSADTVVVNASKLLSSNKIAMRIEELQHDLKRRSDVKKERVLEELKAIAFSDIRDFVEFDGSTLVFKDFSTLTEAQARAIESIKKGKNGIELKLHGKSWSIDRICKMLGFDAPAQNEVTVTSPFERWSEEELAEFIENGREPDRYTNNNNNNQEKL